MDDQIKSGRLVITNGKERHASWLELFFDLVFVITISSLSRHLIAKHTFDGIVEYFFLFLTVWWLWMGMTYYADQFNVEDGLGHFALFGAMLGIILLNIYLRHAFSVTLFPFVMIYLCMRCLLILLYCRAYFDTPHSRELLSKYILGFSVAALCWLVSLYFSGIDIFICWSIGMLIDLVTPPLAYITTKHIPAQVSHMDERFGLFVIIVLGETILDVSNNLMRINGSFANVVMTIVGFLVAIGFWYQYFSKGTEDIIHNALRRKGKSLLLSFVYGYGHLAIFMGIVGFGAGLQLFVMEHLHVDASGLSIMIASVLLFWVANKITRWAANSALRS